MFVFTIIILCSYLYTPGHTASSYDQRQNGELNVQIDLKNVNILALMKGGKEEYVDYDYAYDYSEMTIKPSNGTTPKPLNATTVTVEGDNTTNSTPFALVQTTEPIVKTSINPTQTIETTESALNKTDSTNKAKTTADDATTKSTVDVHTTLLPEDFHGNTTASPITKKCRRGFVQNNEGKCEYKVHGTSNALRKLVKLAQQIKIGRRYRGQLESSD